MSNPLGPPIAKTTAAMAPPSEWDGFGFFTDPDGKIQFWFFDEITKKYGPPARDPNVPKDRDRYDVVLTSVRQSMMHIEEPFTSCFLDPFVYATHMAHMGFQGVMVRATEYSMAALKIYLIDVMERLLPEGYVYTANGVNLVVKGTAT